jgi:hypothetical protein
LHLRLRLSDSGSGYRWLPQDLVHSSLEHTVGQVRGALVVHVRVGL